MAEFKRGDWVRWEHGKPPCIHRHCLFLTDLEHGYGFIDDAGNNFTVALKQLSPDTAPE